MTLPKIPEETFYCCNGCRSTEDCEYCGEEPPHNSRCARLYEEDENNS